MGLDNFKTEDTPAQSSKNGGGDNESKKEKDTGPYKSVGFGDKRKVFETEEMWNDTVNYLENEMDFSIDEVLNWSNRFRHKALHIAIVNSRLDENREFNVTKTCFVCGYTFEFPENWNYVEYKGEPLCPTHEFGEVLEEYGEK